jgi:Mg-chelatase subunit ChlD
MFLPPEAFGSSADLSEDDLELELSSASAWDVATRYHEFRSKASLRNRASQLRKISAAAILERAQELLGSIVHPVVQRTAPWSELPSGAEDAEIDLEETLENSPLGIATALGKASHPLSAQDVWMGYRLHRKQAVVLAVDTSLSMTGEKLALTAVALAVVLLQFPEDPVGIIAFENEAKIVKRPEERISLQQLVERFLDVPSQGYTHLEDGMRAALRMVRSENLQGLTRPPSTVLLTDGKYTAGRDPAYLASRFSHLVVLKMGGERASYELCREMAHKGRGRLQEVPDLEVLPGVMYGVVKDLLRGRSLGA